MSELEILKEVEPVKPTEEAVADTPTEEAVADTPTEEAVADAPTEEAVADAPTLNTVDTDKETTLFNEINSDESSSDENTELIVDEKILSELNTGDLLLFNDNSPGVFGWFTNMIKWGTHSNYSHIAMVLKNPTFLDKKLEGLYIWESSWEGSPDPQDGKRKLGVQITPIREVLDAYKNGHVYARKINTWEFNQFSDYNLKKIHDVVYNKPYDICPIDWVEAFLKKDLNPQKTSRFFCSALVGYIYTKCDVLVSDTDWSILTPNDFSLSGETVKFMPPFSLFPQENKIK